VTQRRQQIQRAPKCIVCGKPVNPSADIMLTVGGITLVPVHHGPCRETVRQGVLATREVVEHRYPIVKFARTLFQEIMKAQSG